MLFEVEKLRRQAQIRLKRRQGYGLKKFSVNMVLDLFLVTNLCNSLGIYCYI